MTKKERYINELRKAHAAMVKASEIRHDIATREQFDFAIFDDKGTLDLVANDVKRLSKKWYQED